MVKSVIKCDACGIEVHPSDAIGVELEDRGEGCLNITIHKDEYAGGSDSHACGVLHLVDIIAKFIDGTIGASSKKVKQPEPVAVAAKPEELVCCEEGGEKCGVHCSHRVPHPYSQFCKGLTCLSTFWDDKPPCTAKGAAEFTLPPTPEEAR